MANVINWFEIPVADFDRAVKFYTEVLDCKISTMDFGSLKMGTFPMDSVGVSGSLVAGAEYTPSPNGVVVYLNCGEDLAPALSRVEGAGGKILAEKKQITPEYGYMALFLDSEGNRLALHSHG